MKKINNHADTGNLKILLEIIKYFNNELCLVINKMNIFANGK